nr:dienelactone hydrolase family protein [Paraburkholderia kirstenboschensis]
MPAKTPIKRAMAENGNATVHSYPGCNHAFARHTGHHYDSAAAELANLRTYELFRRALQD